MPANLENSAVAIGLEKVCFHSNSKERQCQRMFKLPHNCTHLTCQQSNAPNSPSEASRVREPRTFICLTEFRKGRGTRDQIANIHWIIEKVREFQKNIYFCFVDYAKVFVWITTNCGKFLKRWEYQTTLPASCKTCMQVRKQTLELHIEQQNWFQTGKGVCQGCILSPCLYKLTYMQSTLCKMLGWMKHKLESRLLGEISITSVCR